MSSIDQRVVSMKFDNAQFKTAIRSTLDALGSLDKKLTMQNAVKGLEGVAGAANKISLGKIADGVQNLSDRFSALGVVGLTVLSNIANKAVNAGLSMVKSLTIDPVTSGFSEYELMMGSIQTMLANTSRYGTKLPEVTKNLDALNTYADRTIYSFSDMTRNIGLFTNAGIRIGDATSMIKGFSNEAAASGTNAEGAAGAAYQLSQALSAGTIRLQDWRSLTNVGMGNKNMQLSLIQIAKAMGKFNKDTTSANAATKDFNGSLEKKWLTADVMTNYLKIQAGDLTKAQMKNLGLTDKQITQFQKQQKIAFDAATKVRTWTQLIGTLREAVGSSWTDTFRILVGDFNEATTLFTHVNDVLSAMVGRAGDQRNKMLKDWKKLGGRKVLIDAFKNIFDALMGIIKPIQQAFDKIFPPMTGKRLYQMTVMFRDLTKHLKMGDGASKALRSTFQGLFALFSIVLKIVSGVVKYFLSFFTIMSGGAGPILSLTGAIGDLLVKLNDWLTKNKYIEKFFDILTKAKAAALQPVVDFVGKLAVALSKLARGGYTAFVVAMRDAFGALGPIIEHQINKVMNLLHVVKGVYDIVKAYVEYGVNYLRGFKNPIPDIVNSTKQDVAVARDTAVSAGEKVATTWQRVVEVFNRFKEMMAPVTAKVSAGLDELKKKFMNFINGLTAQDALALVNTGLFMAMYVMITRFVKDLKAFIKTAKEGLKNVSAVFDQLTSTLKTMQTSIRADIIQKIAISLLLLAGAVFVLSKVDVHGLAAALATISILLGELIGAMALLEKYTTAKGAGQMAILAVALLALSISLLAMAGAIAILGNMNPKSIIQGLLSITAILALVVGAAALLGKTGGAAQIMLASAAIGILAVGLAALAGVIKLFSELDIKTLLDGGLKIVTILLALSLVFNTMPKDMLLNAAALLVISASLLVLYAAMQLFGMMDGATMAKSLIMLAGSLLIIALAMAGMTEALPGAAALLLVAAALAVLAPVLALLGQMSLKEIGIALLALAGVFLVLGLAGAALTPVVPTLIGLAGAVALLGLAALAAGVGMLAFATGMASLAVSGAAGAVALGGIILAVAETFPLVMQQFGLGIIAFAKVIGTAGPILVRALTVVLNSVLQAIIDCIPKAAELLWKLIVAMITIVVKAIPLLVAAGIRIAIAILTGIRDNIGKIVALAADIIVRFMTAMNVQIPRIASVGVSLILNLMAALSAQQQRLIDRGATIIIAFINGLANTIRTRSAELGAAGGNLAVAIVDGMASGLWAGVSRIVDAAKGMAQSAVDAAKNLLGIHSPSRVFREMGGYTGEGYAMGLVDSMSVVSDASSAMGKGAIQAIQKTMGSLPNKITNIDVVPTITPVLDLSAVKKDAGKLGDMLSMSPISANSSYAVASNVASNYSNANSQNGSDSASTNGSNTTLEFTQNNYSPKALSYAEIYRQTKNQISVAKGALSNVGNN